MIYSLMWQEMLTYLLSKSDVITLTFQDFKTAAYKIGFQSHVADIKRVNITTRCYSILLSVDKVVLVVLREINVRLLNPAPINITFG